MQQVIAIVFEPLLLAMTTQILLHVHVLTCVLYFYVLLYNVFKSFRDMSTRYIAIATQPYCCCTSLNSQQCI